MSQETEMVGSWRSDQVLAWTDREGPARRRRGPSRLIWTALAGAVAVSFFALLTGPDLCPDHRAWVHVISGVAFVGSVVAVIGLLRSWAVAPVITVMTAACGVALGFVDAVHDPARGAFIAIGFGLVTLGAAIAAARQLAASRWDAAVRLATRSDSAQLPPSEVHTAEVAPAEGASAQRVDTRR